MSSGRLKIALCGYGVVGRLHGLAYRSLPFLHPSVAARFELAAVVDPNQDAISRAVSELGLPAYKNLDALEDWDIDGIDCCVPTPQHGEICLAALTRGYAVFCEKPLTGNSMPSSEIVRLSQSRNILAAVNFNFRFVPALQEARRLIASGFLGELKHFRIEYHRSSNIKRWESGSWNGPSLYRSALLDLGPHAIDLAHFLFGLPVSLAARSLHYNNEGMEPKLNDGALLDLEMPGQASGRIEVSKIVPGAENGLNLFAYGTTGTIRFSMEEPDVLCTFSSDSSGAWSKRHISSALPGMREGAIPGETPTGVFQWHAASIAKFVEAALDGVPPGASALEGLTVDIALDAAMDSLSSNSSKVLIRPMEPRCISGVST